MDPLQRRLTLSMAEESRAVHAKRGGYCPACRTAWPCEAYVRAHEAIARLTRPVGRAQVDPRWTAGGGGTGEPA